MRIHRRFGARTARREASYEWATSVDVNLPLHLSHPTPCCCCYCCTALRGNLTTPSPYHAVRVLHLCLRYASVHECVYVCVHARRFSHLPLTNCFVGKREEKNATGTERGARECEPLTKKCFNHRVVYDCLATKLNRSFSTHPSVYARTKRRTTSERESFKTNDKATCLHRHLYQPD